MNLKQYPKALGVFKEYYKSKIKEFQDAMYKHYSKISLEEQKKDEIPDFSLEQLESTIISRGPIMFEFLDDNDIFVSVIYTKPNLFYYDLISGEISFISDNFTKRLDCEYAAIEKGFKILNEK